MGRSRLEVLSILIFHQLFLAAAVLLAASVGQRHEPADESQIRSTVLNAHKVHVEVKSSREEAFSQLPTVHLLGEHGRHLCLLLNGQRQICGVG